MKWDANDIVRVLKIYQNFPLLWNIEFKGHAGIKLKEETFKKFTEQLDSGGLLREMTVKELKAKIKSIKDVYRQEMTKIEVSCKKNGKGAAGIYKPKLAWFDKADFLRNVVSTRKSAPTLVNIL